MNQILSGLRGTATKSAVMAKSLPALTTAADMALGLAMTAIGAGGLRPKTAHACAELCQPANPTCAGCSQGLYLYLCTNYCTGTQDYECWGYTCQTNLCINGC
jgi:hypothetical protein